MTPHVPDPIVGPESGVDPEHEALVADSVGLALLVVLEQLDPAELDGVIEAAWAAAERDAVGGQASTPYLLDFIRRATDGRSLDANIALYRNNIRLACEVATALVNRAA